MHTLYYLFTFKKENKFQIWWRIF